MKATLFEIACPACGKSERLDAAGRLRWLQRAGHLRRIQDPHSPLIEPLLQEVLGRITCRHCSQSGLVLQQLQLSDDEPEDESDWGSARLCEDCRQPIDRERLAILPTASRCVACQATMGCANAVTTLSDENCPKCGSWLHWDTQRTSIRTHRLLCRHCGYRS